MWFGQMSSNQGSFSVYLKSKERSHMSTWMCDVHNNMNNMAPKRYKKVIAARPFVKWAGGKGNLLQQLEDLLPADFDQQQRVTYIEPFVGGGAMLFHMLQNHKCIRRVVINDINADLIRCYQLILTSPHVLIERLRILERAFYSVSHSARRDTYYAYREMYNSKSIHPDERSALFIFLNHTCYNGLYRVNADGIFNVPFGRYKKPIICNEELIMKDHELLSSVEVIIRQPGDYKSIIHNLSTRYPNFIYLDPPYRPLSDTSYFKEYSNTPFGDKQQIELKEFCDMLSNQGCQLMLSNSDSRTENGDSYFEGLYEGYHFERVCAPRYINAKPEKRMKLIEVLIRNY